MGRISNDRGYALILVLLLIVLITSMGAVFMRGAISNAKQEKRTDNNHLSVVAAEMGADYYVVSFTNGYFEVKDRLWKEAVANFYREVRDPESKKTTKEVATFYNNQLKDALVTEFDQIKKKMLPQGVLYIPGPETFQISIEGKQIAVLGSVEGTYADGKSSILGINLKFDLPDVENSSNGTPGEQIPPGADDSIPELVFIPFTIPAVQMLPSFIVAKEENIGTGGNQDRIIRSKGNIDTSTIQDFTSSVSLLSEKSINTNKIYNSKNVDVQSNGGFTTGQLQNNDKSYLKISSLGNVQVNGTTSNNLNTEIITNGSFGSTGVVQDNKGFLTIQSSGNYESGNLYGNTNTTILSNGNFITKNGLIQNNKGFLKMNVSGTITTQNIYENENVDIKVGGSLIANQIGKNKGNLSIMAGENITASDLHYHDNEVYIQAGKNYNSVSKDKKIEGNKSKLTILTEGNFSSGEILSNSGDVFIQSNGNFTANGINNNQKSIRLSSVGEFISEEQVITNKNMMISSQGNITFKKIFDQNTDSFVSSGKNFESGKMQGNSNVTVKAVNELKVQGLFYNNPGTRLFSRGNIVMQKIENNDNVTIVAEKNFNAESIINNRDLLICAGDDFSVKEIKDNQRLKIYVKKPGLANGTTIILLDKKEWKEKCSMDGELPEEKPDEPEKPQIEEWSMPMVDVTYR
ncbi:hypothetical protein DVB69_05290 [Sporosarcina sp. BI001-red]|uniref:hypothetical protein n=1 Tax=Sporosarcina sp. BI001-red TaxID=2282866 RepID=UPI000E277653|nr:hypothetical protein [Sporosarcina sp. BI001-red]REB08553.1 hypothetical protein DVB69_05290 [Sporosarcina sp. BI001-red]